MNNLKYFDDAQNEQRDKWLCADSWQDPKPAEEKTTANQPRVSAPFIIQITNGPAPPGSIADVDIGDSYTNRSTSNFGQNSAIAITSTISGVSYLDFLAQSESRPFKIGRTMIISSSAGQIEQPVTVTHRNASGDRNDHVFTPTVDPYQSQTDRIIDEYEYLFDGFTRLRISSVLASAVVTVRLYPMNIFSATQEVADRNSEQSFEAPEIVKVMPAYFV